MRIILFEGNRVSGEMELPVNGAIPFNGVDVAGHVYENTPLEFLINAYLNPVDLMLYKKYNFTTGEYLDLVPKSIQEEAQELADTQTAIEITTVLEFLAPFIKNEQILTVADFPAVYQTELQTIIDALEVTPQP